MSALSPASAKRTWRLWIAGRHCTRKRPSGGRFTARWPGNFNGDDPLTAVLAERTSAVVVTVGRKIGRPSRPGNVTVSTQGVAFDLVDNGFSARLQRHDSTAAHGGRTFGRHHVPLLLAAVAVGACSVYLPVTLSLPWPMWNHSPAICARSRPALRTDPGRHSERKSGAVSAAPDAGAVRNRALRVPGRYVGTGLPQGGRPPPPSEQAARAADWLVVKEPGARSRSQSTRRKPAMPRSQVFSGLHRRRCPASFDFLLASLNPQDGASGIEGHRLSPSAGGVGKGDRPAHGSASWPG